MAVETRRLEFLVAYGDQSWETFVRNVPVNEVCLSDKPFEVDREKAVQWAEKNLIVREARSVACCQLYCVLDPDDPCDDEVTPRMVYNAWPHNDMLSIVIDEFTLPAEAIKKAEGCGDTLFLFVMKELCREDIGRVEVLRRLNTAVGDLLRVREAFED